MTEPELLFRSSQRYSESTSAGSFQVIPWSENHVASGSQEQLQKWDLLVKKLFLDLCSGGEPVVQSVPERGTLNSFLREFEETSPHKERNKVDLGHRPIRLVTNFGHTLWKVMWILISCHDVWIISLGKTG